LRGKAAKIREKRDGIEGYGDGILSTPEKEVVVEAPVEVSEPTATEVVAEVPAEVATAEVVVETEAVVEVSEPTATEVVAEVPAEAATAEVVSEAAAEDKPAN